MTIETYKKILEHIRNIISGTEFENVTYAVGGCVRDELLGCSTIKDIDLVINLPRGGIKFAEFMYMGGHINGSIVTYETYGTAMFRLAAFPDTEIECVQTRKEQYREKNSRNPETAFGTLEQDCMRRDLSINALYRNISSGEITDPCGKGLSDLKDKIIRVTSTPDIVYDDDPLRILRAIRFSCRLGKEWTLDPATYEGMKKNSSRLEIITAERKQDELNKILLTQDAVRGIEMIKDTGAMPYIIPELEKTYSMTQNEYHFGTVWEHTMKVLENICKKETANDTDKIILRMSALLHDIGKIVTRTEDKNGKVHFYKHELAGKSIIEEILRRLKYPNEFIKEVIFLTENHMVTKSWKDNLDGFSKENKIFRALRKLQYKCGKRRFNLLLHLIDADNKAHSPEHCLPNQVTNIRMISDHMEEDGTDMFDFKLAVTGDDVMNFKGIGPGPDVRRYLDYLVKLCFVNPRMSKEELLQSIKNIKPKQL